MVSFLDYNLSNRNILQLEADPCACADLIGLNYVQEDDPGIIRKRWGRGFSYILPDGTRLCDPTEKARIASLAIPPAYSDVWICPSPQGHILATGRDDQGRKQYIYHPNWSDLRQCLKYARMVTFAEGLPELRKCVQQDISQQGLTKDRVLATVVSLLERTLIRIGNSQYAVQNGSYGLTTIRKKHVDVDVDDNTVTFEFTGKSNKEWHVELEDARIAAVIKRCEEVPGYQLFKYFDDNGTRVNVTSTEVNDYLQRITGEVISAKDFRTWAGTVLTASALSKLSDADSKTASKRNVTSVIKDVAERLGNTAAVCRASYVHPYVIDSYLEGRLHQTFNTHLEHYGKLSANKSQSSTSKRYFEAQEYAVLHLLKEAYVSST
jgi:DNA topoisomerase-1